MTRYVPAFPLDLRESDGVIVVSSAYQITVAQAAAVRRMVAGLPDGDVIEQMLTGIRPVRLTEKQMRDARILELRSSGASYSAIIRELRVTAHTITNAIRGAA